MSRSWKIPVNESARQRLRKLAMLGSMMIVPLLLSSCYYFGSDTDSNSASQPGTMASYYIGQLGSTTSVNHTAQFPFQCGGSFNSAIAAKVGKMATFGYYTLVGPDSFFAISSSPFMWGYFQGFEAGWCYYQDRSFINGINIFADVETGNLGWWTAQTKGRPTNWGTQNVEVIQGFLDAVSASQGVSPGLYMGLNTYNKFTPGAQWQNLHDGRLPFVWWATGPANCGGLVEPPSIQSASWYESEFNKWQQLNQQGSCTNGGDKISLWQYCAACNVNGSTQYDFDITTQAVTLGGTKGNLLNNWTITDTNPNSLNSVSFNVTGDDWNTSWSSGSPPDPCYLWKLICISG